MAVPDEPVDFSPHQPIGAAKLEHASNVFLIDNYDSFTWNVYQYLVLEGATVTVIRNDQISIEELIKLQPTQLVISPGPGHPLTDSGISRHAIDHFGGKIPVLGVCMGEQCMYSVYGGIVDVTGEICHGKSSPIVHDGKGVFVGIPQLVPVTRYHSLAGTKESLPDCLEATAWTTLPSGEMNIIMGIRHKQFTVEGVQFHPEGILTQDGRSMLRNFLMLRGGTWAENEAAEKTLTKQIDAAPAATQSPPSILDKIYNHRKAAVEAQKAIPAYSLANLEKAYSLGIAPPNIPFADRLRRSPFSVSLMAEIKRASPSKGIISIDTCAPVQAREYALAGASIISVLTEPEWFKGSIDDLRQVRQVLDGMPNRPAILRKEFVMDEYQILEARLAGADTVLLIVKMLDTTRLRQLYGYSQSLGMEPLVEVNTAEEMKIAAEIGAQVIGVNNRNLKSFEVDLATTTRLLDLAPAGSTVCALSGISTPTDVDAYRQQGVKAVLIGEALMRASNPRQFATSLLGDRGGETQTGTSRRRNRLVKICGTRTVEAAIAAVEAGADMVGIIRVLGRKRCVSDEVALAISTAVHQTARPASASSQPPLSDSSAADFFSQATTTLSNPHRALVVGVFQNQTLEDVLSQTAKLNLDVVQLHGDEPVEWARLIPVPVIRAHRLDACAARSTAVRSPALHAAVLLDSGAGGTGHQLSLDSAVGWAQQAGVTRVIVAGGLGPDTVEAAIEAVRAAGGDDLVIGVDVSSGVEGHDGAQDLVKIRQFVERAQR